MPDWFTPLLLLLDALAVFRLTRLVVVDRVPFGPLRDVLTDRWPDGLVTEWAHCPWCASLWIAPPVLVAHLLFPGVWPYLAAVLALSAAAGLLSTWEQQH